MTALAALIAAAVLFGGWDADNPEVGRAVSGQLQELRTQGAVGNDATSRSATVQPQLRLPDVAGSYALRVYGLASDGLPPDREPVTTI